MAEAVAPDYDDLVKTQRILNRKHLGWKALGEVAKMAASRVAHGQTNFVRMLWKFNSVYDPKLLLADHGKAVEYEMALPPPAREKIEPETMYVLPGAHRTGRAIDAETERFVDETRA